MLTPSNANNLDRFTIRVYGVLINNYRILVSDELIRGDYYTKFPGGGLEFGEGTRECLQREFKEETGLEVTIGEHLYTTDFFQISAFNKRDQIISIYYYVHVVEPFSLLTKTALFDFEPHQVADVKGEAEVFRWIDMNDLDANCVSLPIDKVVVNMLKKEKV